MGGTAFEEAGEHSRRVGEVERDAGRRRGGDDALIEVYRRSRPAASPGELMTAISTDQFGPPRVPRIEPCEPVASSAPKTRRGLIGAAE